MTTAFPKPALWTDDELETARLEAIADFIAGRTEEGGDSYAVLLATATARVEQLFVATNDLTALGVGAPLVADPSLVGPLRYTAGPAISADDLMVMAKVSLGRKTLSVDGAERIVALLGAARDRARFPWLEVVPPRLPDAAERRVAVAVTASIWAAQTIATKRRNESSNKQEAAVLALLTAEGYTQVGTRKITAPDDLARGEFCAETLAGGVKADVCVRLHNGRLLLIECKVSGSATNSVKRLIHDIGDKVAVWRDAFGAQAIPMGVIAGVFKRKNLVDAQDKGIYLVWERDLTPLAEFLRSAQ